MTIVSESSKVKSKIVATYDYQDEEGSLLFQVVRYEPKDFRQRRPDGKGGWTWSLQGTRRVLYRLPLLARAGIDQPVFLVEGEKDADRLIGLDLLATTAAMGAGKWSPEYSEALRGRHVFILPDNDKPGREHAAAVAQSLRGVAASVLVVELPGLPPKGDVSDWLSVPGNDKLSMLKAIEAAARQAKSAEPEPDHESNGEFTGLATTCLASIRPEPVRWLVPGYLPMGKLILIAGNGGDGKSSLTLGLTADLTTGRPCLGLDYEPQPPCDVLLVSCEDDYADTVVPRLLSAGADLGRVHRVDGVKAASGRQLFNLSHYEALKEELAARPDVRLVIVDPAGAYIGKTGVDDHKDSDLRSLLDPLASLAAQSRVTILLIKHLTKDATAKAVHKVSGSAGYVNSVRAAFMVTVDAEGR